jgi:2-dehydro-3-deoxyphosphooctonate aldolase (KDO 8-P synthase)
MENIKVQINKDIVLGNDLPIVIIAGPCVIESEQHSLEIAGKLKKITGDLGMPFIFKASFDKANRSSVDSYRGLGIEKGLEILAKVKKEIGVAVITDIHNEAQAQLAADVVDIIQIPAFLSRQTDLIKAAAQTGKPVNIKK